MPKQALARFKITVKGVVQGVGFRPFVYKTATAQSLVGSVRNTGEGVVIEVQGSMPALRRFLGALKNDRPPQSKINSLSVAKSRLGHEKSFVIEASSGRSSSAIIPADLAVCAECAREMSDPADRRYEYPFTNCTNCGPR
ncbi:MAG TPA: acylphosphatase, partial [Elusimicrobiales bacterium]|nr:acylphosphatase [Elusimicrobiales bacterium]